MHTTQPVPQSLPREEYFATLRLAVNGPDNSWFTGICLGHGRHDEFARYVHFFRNGGNEWFQRHYRLQPI